MFTRIVIPYRRSSKDHKRGEYLKKMDSFAAAPEYLKRTVDNTEGDNALFLEMRDPFTNT